MNTGRDRTFIFALCLDWKAVALDSSSVSLEIAMATAVETAPASPAASHSYGKDNGGTASSSYPSSIQGAMQVSGTTEVSISKYLPFASLACLSMSACLFSVCSSASAP